jgi:MinD-like ATPase involved in chromosome partitioning or flagellar assembly
MIMETVSFYSYKGGVGRTLLIANTAQFLAMSGRRVVALDLDLEAPGLHHKLGSSDLVPKAGAGELRGAVDELLGMLEGNERTNRLRETAIPVDLPSGVNGSLFLIPAGSAPSQAYWTALERLQNVLRSNRRNGGLPEAILELQARIADEFDPEFLLVDSRTGITELGGLATSILADRVVCLTTMAPESVEGTRVVAEALRTAPRLSSQQPLRVDFLITRVPSESTTSDNVSGLMKELSVGGGSVTVLPHDSGIATAEQVFSDWKPGQSARRDEDEDTGRRFFSATLSWIAQSLPSHKPEAEKAQRRMDAVHYVWQYLTQTTEHVRGGIGCRAAWPVNQLREQVRFGKGQKSRLADIAVYDGVSANTTSKLLMIVEYVDGEDRDAVARWWLEETGVPVVAVLSDKQERRLYSAKVRWDSRAHHSDRWDLPLPHDFKALSDPTDVSIDALLDAVRRGHDEYLDRIVTQWVRCSAGGLHGGAPWKPDVAKKIEDGLARVDDFELARHVLWATSRGPHDRGRWLGDGDDYLEEQVLAELFAPLLWRLPPEASVELMHGHGRPFGPPAGVTAIAKLARDILGLGYDPDATFRVEAQRLLDRQDRDSRVDQDRGIYELASEFKTTEISFAISHDLPQLAGGGDTTGENQGKLTDLATLVSRRIATRTLVTTGLLGDYQPQLGRVVLYKDAISQCAEKLSLKPRHVGSVTLIHETLHALAHLGRDLDGRMWPEFCLPAANSLLFEPSWFHESLTQYFTYQQLLRLRDSDLMHAFETMSAKQTRAYRVWRRLRHIPLEDVRGWFMSVRRGVGTAAPSIQPFFNQAADNSDDDESPLMLR